MFEEALARGILAQPVRKAHDRLEPPLLDAEHQQAVQGRGFAVHRGRGGSGCAPDALILPNLGGRQGGGGSLLAKEGRQVLDATAGGGEGPEAPQA